MAVFFFRAQKTAMARKPKKNANLNAECRKQIHVVRRLIGKFTHSSTNAEQLNGIKIEGKSARLPQADVHGWHLAVTGTLITCHSHGE